MRSSHFLELEASADIGSTSFFDFRSAKSSLLGDPGVDGAGWWFSPATGECLMACLGWDTFPRRPDVPTPRPSISHSELLSPGFPFLSLLAFPAHFSLNKVTRMESLAICQLLGEV